MCGWFFFFFFKQKTGYEIPKRDWSSDVCSSDLDEMVAGEFVLHLRPESLAAGVVIVAQLEHPFEPDLLQVGLIGRRAVSGFQLDPAADGADQLLELLERSRHRGLQAADIGPVLLLEGLRVGVRDRRQRLD